MKLLLLLITQTCQSQVTGHVVFTLLQYICHKYRVAMRNEVILYIAFINLAGLNGAGYLLLDICREAESKLI